MTKSPTNEILIDGIKGVINGMFITFKNNYPLKATERFNLVLVKIDGTHECGIRKDSSKLTGKYL